MLYKELRPLKEKYETIVVSPTTIERELNPTPDFMIQHDVKKKAATFWLGNVTEDICWTAISQWKEAWYDKCNQWRQYMNANRMLFYSPSWVLDKKFQWFYDWMEQIVDLSEPYEWIWIYNLRSHNSLVEVDASWYKLIIKGECDFGIDGTILYDCKTASSRRDTSSKWLTWCYQARFYPRMQFLSHPELDKIPFVYLIFVKNKKMQLQEFKVEVTREEAEWFVKMVLKEYLTKVKNWEIKTSEEALDRL